MCWFKGVKAMIRPCVINWAINLHGTNFIFHPASISNAEQRRSTTRRDDKIIED